MGERKRKGRKEDRAKAVDMHVGVEGENRKATMCM